MFEKGKEVMTEICFVVEESLEGGFLARSLEDSIVAEADSMAELRDQVRQKVECHFDEGRAPKIIRLQYAAVQMVG
jgi:hypothetical protein